jgi:ACS family hexuronate transporter-like MFS transporter
MNHLSAWIPAVCMMLVSLISYVDRNTLAILAPTIRGEAGLSNEDYGYIISAFSLAYMIGNPIWGRWLDRAGVRVGMLAAVSFWTVASAAHAVATGFWSFAVARAALGFGEGATFPGGLRTVMQTLPPEQRARGVALAYSGGSLGAIVAPLVVTPINDLWGWRAAFLFTGLIGAIWLAVWFAVSRRPDVRATHVATTASEPAESIRPTDPRLWSFMLAYALGGLPLAFILYNSSNYLKESLEVSQRTIGYVLWIPPLGWELGYFFWGWMADRLAGSGSARVQGQRRLFTVLMLLSLPLAVVPSIRHLWLVLVLLFVAMFMTAGFIIVAISYATHVYSATRSGLLAGLGAGSWSAGVTVLMPLFGRLFDQRRYDLAFLLAALAPVVGWAGWMWLNRRMKAEG